MWDNFENFYITVGLSKKIKQFKKMIAPLAIRAVVFFKPRAKNPNKY
jgi:hypothetical protein